MGALWRWISLRHLFQEGWRTLLTLAGVALGVAVFVSIRLANHSAMASFSETVDAVAGKANLQISADGEGFDERIFPEVRALPGVLAAAPVVQAYALARPGRPGGERVLAKGSDGPYTETLLLLGVDLFSERPFGRYPFPSETSREGDRGDALRFLTDPRAVAITRALAERHRLRPGDPLTILAGGRPVTLVVRRVLDSPELQQAMGGSVAFLDIAAAQEAFQRFGKLDRIDLLVEPAQREAVAAALRRRLPPGARVGLPQGRTRQVENMVSAFGLNLTALSFIALFVSCFLIFNAVSMAVLRRRREIGIARSLGVERRRIVVQFLAEALVLGVVGSLLGLALGTAMARASLGAVSRTITALYLVLHAQRLVLDPATYGIAFGLGVGMTLLSALAPALEAARTPPGVTVRQGLQIEAQPLPIRGWTLAGFGLLLAAAALALWTVEARRPLGGFASAFLLLSGFSLLAPAFTLLCERLLARPVRALAGVEGWLGARYLREAVARTSLVVAALMASVGMLVGLSIMVGSFRRTVDVWMTQTIRGDLYVEPVGRTITGSATRLPESVVQIAREMPGVLAVDTYRHVEVSYGGRLAYVVGIDFDVQRRYGRLLFMHGSSPEVLARARAGEGVVVSESFAHRHRVRPGGVVTLETPSGRRVLPVVDIFFDYSTDAGAVLMDYRLFWRLWRERRTESLALYLRPGVDPAAARAELIRRVGGRVILHVTPNQALRARALEIFDQTFQITYALQGIAIAVAVLGVISTLTALILQRGREIGVLRAVGARRAQVQKMVFVESGLLGLIGSLMGCVCGLLLALLLTYVINKQFFGWSVRLTIDPWLFAQAILLMLATALAAGAAPARLAASRLAAEAMRVE